jgi:hypothetical protein
MLLPERFGITSRIAVGEWGGPVVPTARSVQSGPDPIHVRLSAVGVGRCKPTKRACLHFSFFLVFLSLNVRFILASKLVPFQ